MKYILKNRIILLLCVCATFTISAFANGEKKRVEQNKKQFEHIRSLLVPVKENGKRTIVAVCEDEEKIVSELKSSFEYWTKYQDLKADEIKGIGITKKSVAELAARYTSNILAMKQRLTEIANIHFVDRSKLEAVKEELKFQQGDWSDENKSASIGKVLNADIIVTFKNTGFSILNGLAFTTELFDVNTFEVFSLETPPTGNYLSAANKPLRDFLEQDVSLFPEMVSFDAVKKSAVQYKASELLLVSPFVLSKNAKSVHLDDERTKNLQRIECIAFDVERKTCTVQYIGGETELARLWTDMIDVSPIEDPYAGGMLTTGKIGTLRIRSASLDISGDMFLYGDQFVIDYMAENEDDTGAHYFAFFTVED